MTASRRSIRRRLAPIAENPCSDFPGGSSRQPLFTLPEAVPNSGTINLWTPTLPSVYAEPSMTNGST
jgi:hypothetical protein